METAILKGEKKNARETALKMKDDGMSEDLIAKYTGLSLEEIEVL